MIFVIYLQKINIVFYKETEYAIRGLVYIQLANLKGNRPRLVEIASEIEAPSAYTAKILQNMVRLGFVESSKGRGGGFYFNPDKPNLILSTLVSAIEGNKIYTGCGSGLKKCSDKNKCAMHDLYLPIRESIAKFVNKESIQSLAKKQLKKLNT